MLYGRLLAVESASADRVAPACSLFLVCGGCDYLHIAPERERALKRARVAEALGMSLERVAEVVSSPRDLHYRAVAKLVFGPNGRLGSYAPRSHRVVDMSGCKVHAPVLERVADAVRRALTAGASTDGARYLVLRAALPREVVHATLVVTEPEVPAERALLGVLAQNREVAEVWRHVNRSEGDALFDPRGQTLCLHRGTEAVGRVGTAEQHIAAGAFAQVNPGAAERLYRRVADLVEPEGRAILDLYSGSGGIALTLAASGASAVLGVEHTPAAVEAARKAATAFAGRVRFEVAPVESVRALLSAPTPGSTGGGFSTWVVNPPRKGLAPEVLDAILTLQPQRLVYVSCHPDRLARDIEALTPLYAVEAVVPVDMFPRTRHIETIVRLERYSHSHSHTNGAAAAAAAAANGARSKANGARSKANGATY